MSPNATWQAHAERSGSPARSHPRSEASTRRSGSSSCSPMRSRIVRRRRGLRARRGPRLRGPPLDPFGSVKETETPIRVAGSASWPIRGPGRSRSSGAPRRLSTRAPARRTDSRAARLDAPDRDDLYACLRQGPRGAFDDEDRRRPPRDLERADPLPVQVRSRRSRQVGDRGGSCSRGRIRALQMDPSRRPPLIRRATGRVRARRDPSGYEETRRSVSSEVGDARHEDRAEKVRDDLDLPEDSACKGPSRAPPRRRKLVYRRPRNGIEPGEESSDRPEFAAQGARAAVRFSRTRPRGNRSELARAPAGEQVESSRASTSPSSRMRAELGGDGARPPSR
jgi:hypothetical protein